MVCFNKDDIRALYFGRFSSSRWSPSVVYKLTADAIFEDPSESFWSARFTKDGYHFSGVSKEMEAHQFNVISPLLSQVPARIFAMELPGIAAPGNKEEDLIFIQFDLTDGRSLQFQVTEYDDRTVVQDEEILNFKGKVKAVINELEKTK